MTWATSGPRRFRRRMRADAARTLLIAFTKVGTVCYGGGVLSLPALRLLLVERGRELSVQRDCLPL